MERKIDTDQIIEGYKRKVEERIRFYADLKAVYDPNKDKEGSYTWSFMHNQSFLELRKVTTAYIKGYEKRYKVQLPELLVRVLTEIGSGGYINTHLISAKNELYPPFICIEKSFLDACIAANIDPRIIEDDLNLLYNFDENIFTQADIQKVYETLGAERDKNLVVLFDVGHDQSIVLNRESNERLVISNVPGISNISVFYKGKEYDIPYYKYLNRGIDLDQAICPLNESWWNKMKADIIQMNENS